MTFSNKVLCLYSAIQLITEAFMLIYIMHALYVLLTLFWAWMSWLSTGDVSGDPPSFTIVKKRNFFRSTSSERESLENIYLVSELTICVIWFISLSDVLVCIGSSHNLQKREQVFSVATHWTRTWVVILETRAWRKLTIIRHHIWKVIKLTIFMIYTEFSPTNRKIIVFFSDCSYSKTHTFWRFMAEYPIEKTWHADTSSNVRTDAYHRRTTTNDASLSTYQRKNRCLLQ